MIEQLLFLIILVVGIGFFVYQITQIRKTIQLGRPIEIKDRPVERSRQMMLVAFGQKKMFSRIIPAILHGILYVSFFVINIEVLEIIIDGISGQHRLLGQYTGPVYDGVIGLNEWLGALVIVASVILLIRRNVLKIPRFRGKEMTESKGLITKKNYSHLDANLILITEIALMIALFIFNIADITLHSLGAGALSEMGTGTIKDLPGIYPISHPLADMRLLGTDYETLHMWERMGWWGHIIGILLFLNYLPISKHFHIIIAFPNVYFSRLTPKGRLDSSKHIQEEVKAAFDFSYAPQEDPDAPKRFGAKDVTDLSWKQLMDSYACTECGRCTSVCPANITGKKLSPRKIVMDVRDRLEEIRKYKLVKNEEGIIVPGNGVTGSEDAASHTLLGNHYITEEELRACTTCNACVEACPVNINQVDIILDLRRHLIMEDSSMPEEWVAMNTNIENNGAPWAMPAADRFSWANDIEPVKP